MPSARHALPAASAWRAPVPSQGRLSVTSVRPGFPRAPPPGRSWGPLLALLGSLSLKDARVWAPLTVSVSHEYGGSANAVLIGVGSSQAALVSNLGPGERCRGRLQTPPQILASREAGVLEGPRSSTRHAP